jgi:mono/diheme cytochrome c family protein
VALARQPRAEGSQSEPTVWDGVYTTEQATRGYNTFEQQCARCHELSDGGVPPRFVGGRFWSSWGGSTLDRLKSVMQQTMPNDSPGRLSEAAYVDIAAFLLQANEIPPGKAELTADNTRRVRLTRRDGDGALPEGAFVTVVGCLAKADGGGWSVTSASEPVRPAEGGSDQTTAEQALGERTLPLLFVLRSLESMLGHKVLVRGLLVRKPADAINVLNVETVETSCPAASG